MNISEQDILLVFEEETNVTRSRLQPSATLASLDIASLDIIGVSFAIEDKFGIIVDAEAFAACHDLGDIVNMIQATALSETSVAS